MKDPRISIRLTADEHIKLKIIAAKKRKSIQKMLTDYIAFLIEEDDKNEKN